MAQSFGHPLFPTAFAFLHHSKPIQSLNWRVWFVVLLLVACWTGHAQTAREIGLSLSPRPFPIDFEANRGQAPSQYQYLFHRDGMQAMFVRNGVDFVLAGPDYRDKPIHLRFLGADARPDAIGPLAAHSNYFLGSDSSRWVRNVPLYSEIDYKGIYHGVSLSFYGNGRELEHDFRVDPGADPGQIALRLEEVSNVRISSQEDLEIRTTHGVLTLRKPVAYQMLNGERREVNAKFLLSSDNTIRFAIGSYDARQPLVIDPVYVFSTYLGGSTGSDQAAAVTTDANGNILVTGTTTSTDFPTSNALQPSLGSNNQSIFVSKFDPTGKTLIYSTYLGGSSQALGAPAATSGAILVDAAGDAIIAGLASSSNFPQAGAIVSPSCQINNECYALASLKPDGSALNYAGLIGGSEGEYTNGVNGRLAVDASGNAYLGGITDSSQFQITPGTLATSVQGYPANEMFVLKVDPTGKLVYSTVVPGNASNDPANPNINFFLPTGLAVDASGDVTAVGTAGMGLPTTPGVVEGQFPNNVNTGSTTAGFVLQLNSTASAINYASYLPGADTAGAFTVDSSGGLWIAGETGETTLPVSANAYQKTPSHSEYEGVSSGYILKISPGATSVLGATYLDGSGVGQTEESSYFTSIALDNQFNVFVGGTTSSADFPLQDPFVTELEYPGDIWDAIVAEVSPDLSTLEFGSFFNSTDVSYGGSYFAGLAVDNSNNLIVAGSTFSKDFPTTPGSFEPRLPTPANPLIGYQHSFAIKINMSTPAPSVCLSTFNVIFGNVNANSSRSQTVNVTNCGNASLNISSIASSDPTVTTAANCSSVAPGAVCPVSLTFTPVSSKATSGTITLTDNAQTIPQSVSFTGQGNAPEILANVNPLSFGHVLVGAAALDEKLLISNGGQLSLSVSAATVSGAGYSLVSNGCAPPANPNFGCWIVIAFAPVSSGTQTGSVVISSNDPATPQLTVALTGVGDANYAIPTISSISAPTVLINSGAVNLTISGANFYPQSVAQLNGVTLPTTFQNNNLLQATIPASSLTAIGEQYLTVVNPLPGGGVSPSFTVTPYQTLVNQPSALVSVSATGMLYAAIPASGPANPNTVIPINPATGAEGTPIPVGHDPQFLAASSDGAYVFVANAADETVQRINLTTNAVERTFPYTPNIYCPSCTNLPATDLQTVPGSPSEVLLAQASILTLYNDSGLVNYIPTSTCCFADPYFSSITLAGNPLTIYGLPFSFGGGYFQVANLTTSGLQYTRPTGGTGAPSNDTGGQVISDGTLLYTNSGEVWNPATQSQVGTFPISQGESLQIALDTSLGQIYSVGSEIGNNVDYVVVSAYSLHSYALTSSLAFPQIYWPTENHLVRWGTNGLAFIAPGVGLTDQEVYILRSSVVSPQSANPAPTLTSISPATAKAGGPAFTLTVNGTSFLSSSLVEWNGTPLSTTYISAQQLTASLPATDIAAAGHAQVAVYNPAPGGGSSSSEPFIIDGPAAPTITWTAPTAITYGTALSGAQLDATASVPGTFSYSPAGGTVLGAGPQTLSVTFTPTDTIDYANATASVALLVNQATPTITWATPAAIPYGTALSATQLDASSTVAGTFVYNPAAGTVPAVGSDTLSVAFTPTDATDYTTATASVVLTVNPTPNFALSASPTSLSIVQNSSGTSTISVTDAGGFSGTVALAASGLPSGVTATFAAGATAGAQVLTLAAGSTAALGGPVTVTVTGTSGALSATTTVSLIVTAAPTFAPSGSTGSNGAISVNPGATTGNTSTISVSGMNGFSGTVNLSCSISPTAVSDPPTCNLSPASLTLSGATAQTSTLTVTTTASSSSENRMRKLFWPTTGGSALALLFFFTAPRRRRSWLAMVVLLVLLSAAGLSSCGGSGGGGGGGNVGTPAGTYTVTITGTGTSTGASSSVTATVGTVTLTVN